MDQRAQYLVQILEKIGSPLMASITEVAGRNKDAGDNPEADAQKMAELLGKAVQASIEIGKTIDTEGTQDDSLRVALAGIASSLIAGQYNQQGQTPGDNDLKKVITSLQAVLTFSENFTPGPENTQRLKDLETKGQPVDTHQVNVQYIHAFIPVVNAIAAYSFGQPEQKLIMDVSDRLVKKAAEIREALLPNLSGDDQKFCEIAVLKALTELYSTCHMAETERLTAMKEEERAAQPAAEGGGLSTESVWKSFDTRAAMLETLAGTLMPSSSGQGAAGKTPAPPPAAPPPETPPAPPAAPPPAETQTPPPTEGQTGGNPMATFAKKPAEKTDNTPPSEAPPPPSEPAAPPTPPPEQPAQPPPAEPPAAEPPPAAPPETPPVQPPAEGQENSGDAAGNPMSFFKGQPKKDDDSGN